ncbi:MAG: PTS fructose transporter subunit IIA [Burkholderiaceae bacterium]
MIAVLIIAHEPFATALMHCTRHVFKRVPAQVAALDVIPDEDPHALLAGARLLGSRINDGSGLVVLTDLYGATPARIAVQLAEPHRVIVFHGVNLPTLLKTLNYRRNMPLEDLAAKLEANGPSSLGLCEPAVPGTPGVRIVMPGDPGSTQPLESPQPVSTQPLESPQPVSPQPVASQPELTLPSSTPPPTSTQPLPTATLTPGADGKAPAGLAKAAQR